MGPPAAPARPLDQAARPGRSTGPLDRAAVAGAPQTTLAAPPPSGGIRRPQPMLPWAQGMVGRPLAAGGQRVWGKRAGGRQKFFDMTRLVT